MALILLLGFVNFALVFTLATHPWLSPIKKIILKYLGFEVFEKPFFISLMLSPVSFIIVIQEPSLLIHPVGIALMLCGTTISTIIAENS